jgi:hypothetical protein
MKQIIIFFCFLSIIIISCSKENDEGELSLIKKRKEIISLIKSDDYDSYLTAFVDEAALY